MNGPEFLDLLLARFPNLANTRFEITSPASDPYNCLAWAADDPARWWWPDALETGYWPPGVLRQATVECFIDAYRTLGYEICTGALLETNIEKLAIFAKGGRPTHIARQLHSGDWTSNTGRIGRYPPRAVGTRRGALRKSVRIPGSECSAMTRIFTLGQFTLPGNAFCSH